MRAPELQLRALELGVGGHVAFAAGERVIAGPERHAAFGRDQHEPTVDAQVPRGPGRDDQRAPRLRAWRRQRMPAADDSQSERERHEEQHAPAGSSAATPASAPAERGRASRRAAGRRPIRSR